MVIRLLHLGHKPKEIARLQAVSIPTVYGWYNRWKEAGIEGLATKPRSGRPPKTDEEYLQMLRETLEKEPQEWGYDFSIWTIERLRLHLEKETGTSLSGCRLRILLKRQGYRYRRPKYDLGHLQDKDAKAQAAELLDELKKRPSQTILSSSLWTKRH
jgi:transposase